MTCVNMILKTIVCFCLFSVGCLASDIVNNDIRLEEENFERPCRLFDMFCIRHIFVKHSQCKEALGPAPDPLYRDQFTAYFSVLNLTITSLKVEYTGVKDARVVEFYINKKTDKLLLALEFPTLQMASNESHFRFHRRGKEPIETVDFTNATFPPVIMTIIIPHIKDLQIQDSEVYSYFTGNETTYEVGPNAYNSNDPTVMQAAAEMLAYVPTLIREAFLTESAFIIASFIKYNICDFCLEYL